MAEVRELEAPGPGGPIRVRLSARWAARRRRSRGVAYLHGGGWAVGQPRLLRPAVPGARERLRRADRVASTTGSRRSTRSRPRPRTRAPPCAGSPRTPGRSAPTRRGSRSRATPPAATSPPSRRGGCATTAARRCASRRSIYPVCDSALNTPSYRENGSGLRPHRGGHEALLGGLPRRRRRPPPDASPLRAGDLAGLPPAFVLTVRARRAVRRGRRRTRARSRPPACRSRCAATTAPCTASSAGWRGRSSPAAPSRSGAALRAAAS